jgi:hypothetical protein
MAGSGFEFDVVFSFAGEERALVEPIADRLRAEGISVFYDAYEQAKLWGKDLYVHLHDIYSRRGRYCVMFVSKDYAQKAWTSHERQAAQERAFREKGGEYILPIRIDDTEIPGLPATISYISIAAGTDQICKLLAQKLHGSLATSAPAPVPTSGSVAAAAAVPQAPKRFGIAANLPTAASGDSSAAVALMAQTSIPESPTRSVVILPFNPLVPGIKKIDAAPRTRQCQLKNRIGSTLFPVGPLEDDFRRDPRGIVWDRRPQPYWHVQFALGFDGTLAHREFISETRRAHQVWGSGVGLFSTLDRVMGAALFSQRLPVLGPRWLLLTLDGITGQPLVFDYDDNSRPMGAHLFGGNASSSSNRVEISMNLDGQLEVPDIVELALSVGEELAFFFDWAWNRAWVVGELEKTLSSILPL